MQCIKTNCGGNRKSEQISKMFKLLFLKKNKTKPKNSQWRKV